MPQNKSIFRNYVTQVGQKYQCNFCEQILSINVSRIKHHFLRNCKKLPKDVQELFKEQGFDGMN